MYIYIYIHVWFKVFLCLCFYTHINLNMCMCMCALVSLYVCMSLSTLPCQFALMISCNSLNCNLLIFDGIFVLVLVRPFKRQKNLYVLYFVSFLFFRFCTQRIV